MNPTILKLVMKVKALADRSTFDGERQAAEHKLRELMRKYKITETDLDSQTSDWVAIKYRSIDERTLAAFLAQVVCGHTDVLIRVSPRKKKLLILLTKVQTKEWRSMCEHYLKGLRFESRMFLSAFIHRNGIKPPPGGKTHELTDAQILQIMKMMAYMQQDAYVQPRPLLPGDAHAEQSIQDLLSGLKEVATCPP